MNQGGYSEPLRFTAALADGRDLYAFRYAVNDKANTLYYRESEDGVVIVSEPLDKDHGNWQAVPENRVVIARHGKEGRGAAIPGRRRADLSRRFGLGRDDFTLTRLPQGARSRRRRHHCRSGWLTTWANGSYPLGKHPVGRTQS